MICVSPRASTIIIHLLSCLIPVLNLIVLLVVLIDYMDDISFSNRRKNRGYTYLYAGSVICESLLRAPQYSTFACSLIPVNLVVLLVVLIDYMYDISFSKRRKNRGYIYLCAGSVICVSLLRAPQYSTFACCLIPVLTLVVLLVMLDRYLYISTIFPLA